MSAPLKDRLADPLGEAAVQRLWRGIDDRRRDRRPRLAFAGWAFAAGAALVTLLWLIAARGTHPAAGPLVLAGGGAIGELTAAVAPRPVPLSDGSTVTLSPGAKLRALHSSDRAFTTLLEAGRVEFDVKKGGPRRWSIACGPATIEVVGTRFTVERSPARVRVDVAEGVVLVESDRLAERVRRLAAGEHVEIVEPEPPAPVISAAPPPAPPPASAQPAPPPPPKPAPTAPAPAWRALAQHGDYRGAYEALGAQGISSEARTGDVEALLALADVARLSGHPAEAVAPLSRVVDEHPGNPHAALAAFTLGRIEIDQLGRFAAAANSFDRALSLGLSASLVEDARARIVEARARSGDREGARAAAADYERLFPNGTHLAAVRRWVE